VLIAQSVASLTLVVILVGVADLGAAGAVIGNVSVAAGGAAAVLIAVGRKFASDDSGRPLGLGELTRFGVRVYPASVTGFFSYRIDVFLLGFLLPGAPAEVTAMIGLYTLAVSLAELTFFVPDSVATVFFPRVAGADRRSADEMTPMVSRMTVLATLLVTAALIPAGFIAVHLILPAFVDALPAFLVLLPGVVALAVAKVLSSYVSGVGRPAPVAIAGVCALVVNIIANVLLIPVLGIVGASLSSVISYTVNTAILLVVVLRLSHMGPGSLLVPTRSEATQLLIVGRSVARRIRSGQTGGVAR